MKYELDWNGVKYCNIQYSNKLIIKILTGLTIKEIEAASPAKEYWNGQDFVSVAKKLGFNANDKFCKFNPSTDKPCIMRSTSYHKGYWWAWIYDGELVNNHNILNEWQREFPDLRITSMLQIWL